jgi:hypothetical protein
MWEIGVEWSVVVEVEVAVEDAVSAKTWATTRPENISTAPQDAWVMLPEMVLKPDMAWFCRRAAVDI